jgi:hypothetical protein
MPTKSSVRRQAGARKRAASTRSTRAAKSAPTRPARDLGRPTPERPSKGISRIDQPSRRTHGFFVRLDYRKTPDGYRPRLVAFFGDASHGGKRAAWKAAEEWADRNRRTIKRAGTKGAGARKRGGARKAAGAKSAGTRKRAGAAKRR